MKKLLLLLIVFCAFTAAKAQTIYVDQNAATGGDGTSWVSAFQTIEEAVEAASPNNEILIAEGVYQPVSELDIDIPLTFKGGYPPGGGVQDISSYTTQIQADADPDMLNIRIFDINIDAPVFMSGLSFDVFDNAIISDSNLNLMDCNFNGGLDYAVLLSEQVRHLFADNCEFTNMQGPAIASFAVDSQIEEVVISNTTFENGFSSVIRLGDPNSNIDNVSLQRCRIENYTLENSDLINIEANTITINDLISQNNQFLENGSDHFILFGNSFIKNSKFLNNEGLSTSSSMGIQNFGNLTMENCLFSGQENLDASGAVAGVQIIGGDVLINNTKFIGNTVGDSFATSAISLSGGSLTVSNSTFENNVAKGSFSNTIETLSTNDNDILLIDNCIFSNNEVDSGFSGIVVFYNNIEPIITNSIFSNNTASNGGSILETVSYVNKPIEVTNTIFENNNVAGAILKGPRNSSGAITFTDNTFRNNTGKTLVIEGNPLFTGTNNVYQGFIDNDFDDVTEVRLTNEYYQGNSNSRSFIDIQDGLLEMENVLMFSEVIDGDHMLINSRSNAQMRIDNSTFTATDFNNTNVRIDFDATLPSSFRNSIIWSGDNLSQGGLTGNSSNLNASYSLIKGENLSGTGNLNGTLLANTPEFVNPYSNDFRMLRCSPTVNAGFNDFVSTSQDFNGNPRIFQSTVDLGAFELQINANPNCNTPTAPSCSAMTFPANGSNSIPIDTPISWNAQADAIGYFVSIGTTSGGTELVNNREVINSTTLALQEDLPENTQIFVTISPYNGAGTASGCTSRSFTTEELTDSGSTLNLLTQNITIDLDASGNATIQPSDVDNGSSSTAGGLNLSLDQTSFSCEDIGPNTVTLTGTDNTGTTDSRIAVVTVEDNLAPSISCSSDLTEVASLPYILPDYYAEGTVTATDNCTSDLTQASQDPAPGTPLSAGTYAISISITDVNGNLNTCEFNLTVDDVLSTDEVLGLDQLSFYPNPAKSVLKINNPQEIALEQISIYDLVGRKIVSYKNPSSSIELSMLSTGHYILKAQTKSGEKIQQLIIE